MILLKKNITENHTVNSIKIWQNKTQIWTHIPQAYTQVFIIVYVESFSVECVLLAVKVRSMFRVIDLLFRVKSPIIIVKIRSENNS